MKEQFIIKKLHKKIRKKNIKAFGLAELMVSIGLIAIILSGTVAVIINAFIVISLTNQKARAFELLQEQSNALNDYKKYNWSGIKYNSGVNGSNPKYFQYTSQTDLISLTTSANNSTTINVPGGGVLANLSIGDSIALSSSNGTFSNITQVTDTQITVADPLGNGTSQYIVRHAGYKIKNGSIYVSDNAASFTISFNLDKATRNNNGSSSNFGNLDNTQLSYIEDTHYIWSSFKASWNDITNKPQTVYLQSYINDFDTTKSVSKLYNEIKGGATMTNTTVNNNSGNGSLVLVQSSGSYVSTGIYISQIYDSGNANAEYYSFDYTSLITSNVSVNVYFRAATTRGSIASASWTQIDSYCSDIPSSDLVNKRSQCNLYTVSGTPFTGKQYFQVKLVLNSTSSSSSPNITSLEIYNK